MTDLDKIKNWIRSFGKVIMSKHASNFILSDLSFHTDIDFMEVYNPVNDFV